MKHAARWMAWVTAGAALLVVGGCGGGGGGGSDDPANSAPVISSAAAQSVAENTAAVVTVAATDADGDTLSYSLTGGADQALFTVGAASGALSFAAPPDYENPGDSDDNNAYLVEVTVSDGNGGSDVQAFTVTVTDVNETTSLHGVAAAGAPIVGTVTVKDSLGAFKTVLIEADGSYDVDVSDMTGPFALRADGHVGGHDYHLYSAATEADVGGTINITPFTNLIVTNIAGDIAANYFDSGAFSSLTPAEIDAVETALQEKLQPILTEVGLGASLDLLRTAFAADHSQLDGILDVMQVTVDPQTLTAEIVNILTDNSVTMDVETGAFTGDFTTTDGTVIDAGLTDLEKIVAGFDTFTALFATSLPAPDAPALLDLFDQTSFRHDGMGLNQFLSDPTSDPSIIGIQFTNVTVIDLDPTAGTGVVGFDVVLGGKAQTDAPNRFRMVRGGDGKWRMQGNQRLLRTHMEVVARYWVPDTRIESYLHFSVRDDGGSASSVDYVIVKGPGLPTDGLVPEGGVVLVRDISDDEFIVFDGTYPPANRINEIALGDATVDTIPEWGAQYFFTLWNANGTPGDPSDDFQIDAAHAPYREWIRARPYKPSELSAANFAAITSTTPADFHTFAGGTVGATWTIPQGLWADYLYVNLWGTGSETAEGETMLAPTDTSASFTVLAETGDGTPFTVQWRNLSLGLLDDGGRSLSTHLY